MSLLKKWNEGNATWGIWKVTETPEELHAMLTTASCDEAELARFKAPGRQLEYLAVRVLLRALTGEEHRIGHLPSGKPYLVDVPGHITISHTKGYVAVGLHPEKEIGIDIEQVAERVRKVTSRFVRTDELPGVLSHEATTQLYEYLLVWSAKESLFKVMNTSEVDFLEHLYIAPFELQPEGQFIGKEFRTPLQRVCTIHYLIHSDFVCTYLIVQ